MRARPNWQNQAWTAWGSSSNTVPEPPCPLLKEATIREKCPTRIDQYASLRKECAQKTATSVSAENVIDSDSYMPFDNLPLPSPSRGKHTFSVPPLIVGYSMCEPGKVNTTYMWLYYSHMCVVVVEARNEGWVQSIFLCKTRGSWVPMR